MEKIMKKTSSNNSKDVIWDCGSSLYDSFELKSFERQLDSAISSRTMSMPHLSDRRQPPPPPSKKPASKISRSLQRLIRSVFRPKNNNNNTNKSATFGAQERFYAVYDKSAALSAIPEAPEFDGLSPEISSLVRRTASDRFTVPSSVGIYCA